MSDVPGSARLLFLLELVEREGRHLLSTLKRLFVAPVTESWVESLEGDLDLTERLDAFVARFGRMQDTIGDKLVPEIRRLMLETPGAALDNLNRMEKLGLLPSVADWVEARNLRNRLVHEYMRDPREFAAALDRARQLVPLLVETYNALNAYAKARLDNGDNPWPGALQCGK